MKDELGGKNMTEFVALRAKMCAETVKKIVQLLLNISLAF